MYRSINEYANWPKLKEIPWNKLTISVFSRALLYYLPFRKDPSNLTLGQYIATIWERLTQAGFIANLIKIRRPDLEVFFDLKFSRTKDFRDYIFIGFFYGFILCA